MSQAAAAAASSTPAGQEGASSTTTSTTPAQTPAAGAQAAGGEAGKGAATEGKPEAGKPEASTSAFGDIAKGKPGEADAKGKDGKDAAASAEGKKPDAAAAEFKLELPEGVQLDKDALTHVEGLAKEHGGNPAKLISELAKWQAERAVQAVQAQDKTWSDELKNHPVVGGKNFAAAQQEVLALMHRVEGGAELASDLHARGFGNYPGLFVFLHRLAVATREDQAVGTGSSAPTDGKPLTLNERAQQFYKQARENAQR